MLFRSTFSLSATASPPATACPPQNPSPLKEKIYCANVDKYLTQTAPSGAWQPAGNRPCCFSAGRYAGSPDLFISVDLSVDARLNKAFPVLERSRRHVIIDHHPCETHTGEAFVIRPQAAAVGVIVTEYALHLGVRLKTNFLILWSF